MAHHHSYPTLQLRHGYCDLLEHPPPFQFYYYLCGYTSVHVEIRELLGVSFLPPPCRSWGLNPGCQAWQQAPLPAAEPLHWPVLEVF